MLIGEYIHTLDPKKRLSLPAKFRRALGKTVVVTKGLDNCLFVYPEKEWKTISRKLSELPFGAADSRGFGRFMFSGATEVDVDSSGRVLIPDFLRRFASLKDKVVLAGVHSRIEIWNERTWNTYKSRIEKEADTLAEKLGDVGMI
jgi:MraZ protein|tara:strand:- start:4565 stop:4999 length:435 start_codon:yes stop_codon:yes gene_type:complete